MIDLCIRKRFTTKGVVYEYRFEIASINGKRKWMTKSGFKTITDARKAGKLAMAQYENYGQVVKDQISVADFLDEWFEKDCMVDLKATTLTNYRKIVDNILKPELGALRLRSLTREQLQTLLTDIYDLGYSKNSLITIKAVLTKSMNYAVDNHYIVYSPAVRLKIPRNRIPQVPTRSTPHFFIRAETMKKIFERFPARSSAYIPLKLGYECGLRLGEVFGLCWEDVDLDAKVIHINRQVQWLSVRERNLYENLSQNGSPNGEEGYWYFSAPKYDSYRTIEISDRLAEVLSSARKAQKKSEEFYEDYYQRYYANNKLDISAAIPNRIGMLPTKNSNFNRLNTSQKIPIFEQNRRVFGQKSFVFTFNLFICFNAFLPQMWT